MRVDGTRFTGTVALAMLALASAPFYRRSQTIVGHEAGGGGGDGCPPKSALAPIPKPAAATPEEIAHVKLLDEAIAPSAMLRFRLTMQPGFATPSARSGLARCRTVSRSRAKFPIRSAASSSNGIGCGQAMAMRLNTAPSSTTNPAWPDRNLMTQRLEEALFTQGGSAAAIKAAFKDNPPRTGIGMAALASALLAEGDTESAESPRRRGGSDPLKLGDGVSRPLQAAVDGGGP